MKNTAKTLMCGIDFRDSDLNIFWGAFTILLLLLYDVIFLYIGFGKKTGK